MDEEHCINAFAAGFRPGDCVIGVSRGTLDYLTRDELQGVMAHEFSHILNGDMRLNLWLIGILHGILLLSYLGDILVRLSVNSQNFSRRDRDKRDGNWETKAFVVGLGLQMIGFLGVFFGSLIKSAVSKQREFLADASAVQFTRNPAGIAGALKKMAWAQAVIRGPGRRRVTCSSATASVPRWSTYSQRTHCCRSRTPDRSQLMANFLTLFNPSAFRRFRSVRRKSGQPLEPPAEMLLRMQLLATAALQERGGRHALRNRIDVDSTMQEISLGRTFGYARHCLRMLSRYVRPLKLFGAGGRATSPEQ